MNIPELIHTVLGSIRNQWYPDAPRDFLRDQTALTKAIARFGYCCDANGWAFTADEIFRSIMDLLQQIKRTQTDIQYLPVYLQGAIDRHLRMKAEEYNARAKARRAPGFLAERIVSKLQSQISNTPAPSATEVLATVYKDLAARRKRKFKKPTMKTKQEALL